MPSLLGQLPAPSMLCSLSPSQTSQASRTWGMTCRDLCIASSGLCSAASEVGDTQEMGRETTVSSSLPCISFQKENVLFFSPPRSVFPIHIPASSNNQCFKHALQQSRLSAVKLSFTFEHDRVSALAFGLTPGRPPGCSVPASEQRRAPRPSPTAKHVAEGPLALCGGGPSFSSCSSRGSNSLHVHAASLQGCCGVRAVLSTAKL